MEEGNEGAVRSPNQNNMKKAIVGAVTGAVTTVAASAAPAFDMTTDGTTIATDVPAYAAYGIPILAAMTGLGIGIRIWHRVAGS